MRIETRILPEISRADVTDLSGILALYAQLNPDDAPTDSAISTAIWAETCRNNHFLYFVVKVEAAVVGTCNVSLIPNLTRAGRPFALIENVIVHADFRRRKIGRLLMEAAIAEARAKNCYKVILLSSCKRTEAHRFYESLGFDGDSKKGFEIRF